MITTYNLLSNITNIVVDNYNTNIRNCLNGTLFPAIQIMKNPTNEFNLGLIQTYGITSSATSITTSNVVNYEMITNGSINSITNTVRAYSGQPLTLNGTSTTAPTFSSPYLVPGSATVPRIQTSLYNDMHLIIAPEFFVALKSGTLSELFH